MNTDKIYTFPEGTLEKELDSFGDKGILQFAVTDKTILTNKQRLLRFINLASKKTPEVLFEFLLDITLLDSETIRAFSNIYCSITILVSPEFFSPKSILRKTYTKKCGLLNQEGLVFGFLVDLENTVENLSLKAFREGIDFLSYYVSCALDPLTEGMNLIMPCMKSALKEFLKRTKSKLGVGHVF